MSEYSKVTLNQLDIDAIADYVVESRNLVYRNNDPDSSSNKAMDVDQVAGVNSDLVAVAIDKNNRNTVENALQLGGIPADQFMTMTTGAGIASSQIKMKKSYGDEIQNLKDELYQLRNELTKTGMIENRGQYGGFIDTFIKDHYVNIQDELGVGDTLGVTSNNEIHIEDADLYNSLNVYDLICVENKEDGVFDIKEIAKKNDDTGVITLDSDLRAVIRSAAELTIRKSKGIIYNGTYRFASNPATILSEEEYHTGLSDDTYNVIKRLNKTNEGFGYNFRVPFEKQGFVTSFEICARAVGSPGALVCYLIDARDLDKFLNPVQAEQQYLEDKASNLADGFKFFAKSQPYALDSSLGKRYIKFNFLQSDGTYPLMTRDEDGETVRYIAIIEPTKVDASNYIDIVFLQHKNSAGELVDLELNNTTYYYKRQSDISTIPALTTDEEINKTDMYYHIVTRGIIENEPEAQKQGLYSAHYSYWNTKNNLLAGKARLTMRIKREGQYETVIDEVEPKVFNAEAIKIKNENASNNIKTIDDLRLKTDIYKRIQERQNETDISQQVKSIIGNNIIEVQGFDTETITTKNPTLIKNEDKVYRCGYLVNLKARKIEFTPEGVLTIGDYTNYILPLTEVFKDFEPISREYSDRLLFEADLSDKHGNALDYNDFELQIFWENRELSNYTDIKKSQMGAIKDLILTLNSNF